MTWINIKRIFKQGFLNFWRNGLVSVASVLSMTITLFAIGVIFLGVNFLSSALAEVKDKVDISIAFKAEASEVSILAFKKELSLLPEIKDVSYSSREEELLAFRERHKDNAILIGSLEEVGNPFGARLNVRAVDPNQYEKVAKFIKSKNDALSASESIIDQVSYKKDVVDKMSRLIDTSQRLGWAIAVALALLSVFAVFNTVSLAIYTVREEISVMRLVGAGNTYVKGPFMVEGMIAGFLASLLAIILLYPSVLWVKSTTEGVYGGINLVSFYFSNFGQILLLLMGTGLLLGLVASYWATRRYAKV